MAHCHFKKISDQLFCFVILENLAIMVGGINNEINFGFGKKCLSPNTY